MYAGIIDAHFVDIYRLHQLQVYIRCIYMPHIICLCTSILAYLKCLCCIAYIHILFIHSLHTIPHSTHPSIPTIIHLTLYTIYVQARLKRIRKQEEYLANQRRLEGFANGTDHDRDAEGEGEGDGTKEVEKEGVKEVVLDTSSKNKEESKDTHAVVTQNTQNNHTLSDTHLPTPSPASTPPPPPAVTATSTSPVAASPQVSPRPPPPLHFSQEKTHHFPKITCPNDFI